MDSSGWEDQLDSTNKELMCRIEESDETHAGTIDRVKGILIVGKCLFAFRGLTK